MLLLIDLTSLMLLGFIVFQDFKQREISWGVLPLLFASFVLKAFFLIQIKDIFAFIFFNLGFIAIQLIFLTLWMSFKNRKWTSIIDVHLGLGDILFFVAISSAFGPFQFVIFYVSSIILTLLGFIIYKWRSKNVNPEIPLAGAMSVVLILCLLLSIVIPQLNFYNQLLFISAN